MNTMSGERDPPAMGRLTQTASCNDAESPNRALALGEFQPFRGVPNGMGEAEEHLALDTSPSQARTAKSPTRRRRSWNRGSERMPASMRSMFNPTSLLDRSANALSSHSKARSRSPSDAYRAPIS